MEAAKSFERALLATPDVPQLHVHAAHAYFKLKRFKDVLRHSRAASALKEQSIAQPLLEARALVGLKRDGEAYTVLSQACQTFKNEFRPCLELAALAHRKTLTEDVRRIAQDIMIRNPDRDAVISLFHLLYTDSKALPFLERLVARYPTDPEIRGHLGHVYAGNQKWVSAARLFEDATAQGGRYAFEAADQYRMAGRYRHALRMNGQLPSSRRQAAQRVAILFEQRQYARIVAMDSSFNDSGSNYRVAYSHYAVGDHAGASKRARALLETSYQDEAAALLRAMEREQTR